MTFEEIAELEQRLQPLEGFHPVADLRAIAGLIGKMPERMPMTGAEQGECLDIALRIRELAKRLNADEKMDNSYLSSSGSVAMTDLEKMEQIRKALYKQFASKPEVE